MQRPAACDARTRRHGGVNSRGLWPRVGVTIHPVSKSPASKSSTRGRGPSVSRSTRAPRAKRLEKEAFIVAEAEQQFARFGFEGVSLDTIAAELGMSRQNILYYYASKEDLDTGVHYS